MGGQLGCRAEHPVCTVQRCSRCLQKAAQGGSRAAFWSVRAPEAKGADPSLRERAEMLVAASPLPLP